MFVGRAIVVVTTTILLLGMFLVIPSRSASAAAQIPTLVSTCVQYYVGLPRTALVLIPLQDMLQCYRTTPMNASRAYDLAKYAQLAYELHSVRSFLPSSVSARLVTLLQTLFVPSSIANARASEAVFSSVATGISEYDFHWLLTNAFAAATDYHFQYLQDNTFGSSFLSRAIVYGSRWNTTTSQQEVYVRGVSRSTLYWQRWFSDQSSVRPIPASVDPAFRLEDMMLNISRAASLGLGIASINGMDPVSRYFAQLWRSASDMADDHAAFNDLLTMNLNPTVLKIPFEYVANASTTSTWPSSAPTPNFAASWIYSRLMTPLVLTNGELYYEDYVFSDGSTARVPLLVDLRNQAAPSSDCVVGSAAAVGATPKEVKLNASGSNGTSVRVRPDVVQSTSKVAMRPPQLKGEELYDVLTVDSVVHAIDPEATQAARASLKRRPRRRLDVYSASSEDTSASLSWKTYSSEVASAYFIRSPFVESQSVMYLRLHSLYGSSGFSSTLSDIGDAFNSVLNLGYGSKSMNLVIDVRGNGGGYVDAMQFFLGIIDFDVFQDNYTTAHAPGGFTYLTPNPPGFRNSSQLLLSLNLSSKIAFNQSVLPNPVAPTDMYRRVIGPDFYLYQLNQTFNGTGQLNKLTMPNETLSPSTWFYQSVGPLGQDYNVPNFENPSFWNRPLTFPSDWTGWTNITLVTDGECGSACCMLETRLLNHLPTSKYTFTSVGFGGLADPAVSKTGPVPQRSQFCGGSVLSMYCTPEAYQHQTLEQTQYRFPGRYELYQRGSADFYPVDMRFNEYHYLSNPQSNVPRQFLDEHVNHQVLVWDVSVEDVVRHVFGDAYAVASAAAPLTQKNVFYVVALVLSVVSLLV